MTEPVKIIAKHNNNSTITPEYCVQSAVNYLGTAKDALSPESRRAAVELARAWMELSHLVDHEGYVNDI